MTSDRLLSVADAAKHTPTFSEVSLRRMAREGEIPAIRRGRRVFFFESQLRESLGPLFVSD
jgi:hypothetical protein